MNKPIPFINAREIESTNVHFNRRTEGNVGNVRNVEM